MSDDRDEQTSRDRRATLPPPGPPLAFREWGRAVYQHVHRYLPDTHATGSTKRVRLTLGSLAVRIEPDGEVWWVYFDRGNAFAMPPLCVSRRDSFTATNVAGTILGFFDSTLSTPNKRVPAPANTHKGSEA